MKRTQRGHPTDSDDQKSVASRVGGLARACLLSLLLGVAVLLAFAPAMGGEFLNWDDDRNFLTNFEYRGIGADQFRWAWQTYHLGVWQPVSWIILGAQWRVGGLSPQTYHLTSLGLHLVNGLLLYLLMLRLFTAVRRDGPRKSASADEIDAAVRFGAAASTILFVVHPLRVEPVVWISCQPYLPAAMFYLLAVLAYLRAVGDSVGSADERVTHSRIGWFLTSLVCYAIALGSKATAVSLPIVLVILDVCVLRRCGSAAGTNGSSLLAAHPRASYGRCVIEKLPYVALALPVCLWAVAAKDYSESRAPWAEFDLSARLAQASAGTVFYLSRSLLPIGLSPYYRIPAEISLSQWPYAASAAAVACMTLFLVVLRRRYPHLLGAWLIYLVILLPNLGLVQISQQLAADRYAYLAIMPGHVLLAALLGRLWRSIRGNAKRRTIVATALVAVMAVLIHASRSYAAHWTSSVWLWQRALSLDPDCAVSHCNLAEAYLRVENYAEASSHLSRAIELEPNFSFAYVNFAALLLQAGHYEDAATAAEHAIESRPPLAGLDLARAHAICGEAFAALGRTRQAWEHTLKARELGFVEAEKMLNYLRQRTNQGTARQPSP